MCLQVHASKLLLTDLLKVELGFRGLVVSDYNAVQQCGPSYEVALASCINAGIDMVMTAGGLWGDLPLEHQLRAARRCVEQGAIPLERIDDAVRRILRVKAALGLPMPMPPPAAAPAAAPVPLPAAAAQAALQMAAAAAAAAGKAVAQRDQLHACVGCASHRRTAREAVRKSAVLLRLRNGVLPLQVRPHAHPAHPTPLHPLRPCTAAPPPHLFSRGVAPSCSYAAAARMTSACSAAAGRCSGRASRATRTRAARQSGRSAARPSPGASPPTPPITPTLALLLALSLALILDLARACFLEPSPSPPPPTPAPFLSPFSTRGVALLSGRRCRRRAPSRLSSRPAPPHPHRAVRGRAPPPSLC